MSCMYLERQPRLHFVCQDLRYTSVEVREDLHCKLGFDSALADQIIESVCKGHAYAKLRQRMLAQSLPSLQNW